VGKFIGKYRVVEQEFFAVLGGFLGSSLESEPHLAAGDIEFLDYSVPARMLGGELDEFVYFDREAHSAIAQATITRPRATQKPEARRRLRSRYQRRDFRSPHSAARASEKNTAAMMM
jgi:hypothetical protein